MHHPPMIHPVILAGGAGTRLWPLSRQSYPKQFSKLMGEESLFQDSAKRMAGNGFAAPLVLTADDFRFIVTEQMAAAQIAPAAILIEPEGRNTAPAVLAAALWLEAREPEALMLVAPSDHVIADTDGFCATVNGAAGCAAAGDLVTFGITPDRAETGYGYLELPKQDRRQGDGPHPLVDFIEKPNAATASEMLAQGNYLWNAGIFLFSVKSILAAYQTHAPDLFSKVAESVRDATLDLGFTRLAVAPWMQIEGISIDYAIMEKTENLSVMPYSGGWSDLGSWDAVHNEVGPDTDGNVCSENSTAIDCRNSLLRSESGSMELVGIGLDNIIAIAMPDAVLVAHKSDGQRVKEAVAALKFKGAKQADTFPRDHRPWGWFESLVVGNRFQVKRIVVNPGAALSLQSHHHRSEHWIVVEGTAKVTIGDEVRLVGENQSVYIPLGAKHRMENPGKLRMVLIEVQTGSYLGEDDIIRFEDIYSRD